MYIYIYMYIYTYIYIGRRIQPSRFGRRWPDHLLARPSRLTIAHCRRDCSWSRVRVNWVIIHLRPGGVTL